MSVRSKPDRELETPAEPEHDGSALPVGWVEAPLDGLVYLAGRIGWRGLTAAEYTPTGPMFLSVPNLNHGDEVDFTVVNHISQERYDESPEIKLQNNDILLTKDGAGIGKLGFIKELPSPATVNSSLLVIRALEAFEPKYLFYCLKAPEFQGLAQERITGSTTPHLFQKDIKTLRVRIAPLPEQRRIVGKLELLLGRVSRAKARLDSVPALLKRFRQSVLAAACSGKLTADWREENPDNDSTDSLRQQIDKLRRSAWKQQRAAKGQSSRDGDYPMPALPSHEFDFDDPEGWLRCSMDELTSIITSGSRDWKQYYQSNGPGTFVMAQNVRPLLFDRSYRLAVAPPDDDRDRVRSEVREGDLLVTIVGANTGNVCRIPEPLDQFYVCQSVALMRPVVVETAKFLELFLNSSGHGLAQYRKWIYGEGRPHLRFDHLRETAVLLPPLSEQQEIVRRVEKLFAFADQIEARLRQAQSHVDKLTQSILAKAFRGELVPTEAELARREGRDYEPASKLLERLQRDKAATIIPSRTTKRRSKLKQNRDTHKS